MEVIAQYCGCLPCLLTGYLDVHTTIEHVTERGRRIGKGAEQHAATIGLCVWHHFGHTPNHRTRQQVSDARGPSLIWGRHLFEDFFGDEVDILLPCQDYMIGKFYESPWLEYTVPRRVAREVRQKWTDLNAASQ